MNVAVVLLVEQSWMKLHLSYEHFLTFIIISEHNFILCYNVILFTIMSPDLPLALFSFAVAPHPTKISSGEPFYLQDVILVQRFAKTATLCFLQSMTR